MAESADTRPTGRPTKFDPSMCEKAHAILSEGAQMVEVAAALDISRQTLYRWMKENPIFRDAIKRGQCKSLAWDFRFRRENYLNPKYKEVAHEMDINRKRGEGQHNFVHVPGLAEASTFKEQFKCLRVAVAEGNITPYQAEKLANLVKAESSTEVDDIKKEFESLRESWDEMNGQ